MQNPSRQLAWFLALVVASFSSLLCLQPPAIYAQTTTPTITVTPIPYRALPPVNMAGTTYQTMPEGGLRVSRSDGQGGMIVQPLHAGPEGLASDHVTALIAIEGDLWVGTADAGISILDVHTGQWHTLNRQNSRLPSDTINHITFYPSSAAPFLSHPWVSTDRGAARWNQNQTFSIVDQSHGLPSNNVFDVQELLSGMGPILYFWTDAGVVMYGGAGLPTKSSKLYSANGSTVPQQQRTSTHYVTTCPALTRAEAKAILGVDAPQAPDGNKTLCGFGGLTTDSADFVHFADPPVPGVAATVFAGEEAGFMVEKVVAMIGGNPEAKQNIAYTAIKNLLADGMITEAVGELCTLVKHPTFYSWQALRSQIGETAVFLAIDGGERVALVATNMDGKTAFIFADLPSNRDLNLARAAMQQVANRLIGAAGNKSVAPVATTTQALSCPVLNQTKAAVIIGPDAFGVPDQAGGLCGYGGVAQKLATIHETLTLSTTYGLASGILTQPAATRLFRLLLAEMKQTNGIEDETTYRNINALLAAGRLRDALIALNSALPHQSPWDAKANQHHTVYYTTLARTGDRGDYLVVLFATLADQKFLFLTAHLPNDCYQGEILDTMMAVPYALAGD